MKEIKKGTQVLVMDKETVTLETVAHFDGNFYGFKDRVSVPKEMVWRTDSDGVQHAIDKLTHMLSVDKEVVNISRRRLRKHQKLLAALKERT